VGRAETCGKDVENREPISFPGLISFGITPQAKKGEMVSIEELFSFLLLLIILIVMRYDDLV